MASYELLFKRSVTKDLRRIEKADVQRILQAINTLVTDPRGPGCKKLSGQDLFRVRLGAYRIIYQIRDEELVIIVIKVAHRSTAYR
jgi:mRNA interferase RelE/StbE